MPIYSCRIAARDGRTRQIIRESESEDLLISELNRESVYPLSIRAVSARELPAASRERFTRSALYELIDSLSVLLSGGLTFKDALEIAQTIFAEGGANRMIVRLLEQVHKGRTVYEAVDSLGPGIPPIVRGFVKIGERVGSLERAFARLSEYLAAERKLREKLSGSLTYPVLVVSVAAVGVIGIATFILPKIRAMFDEIGSALPPRFAAMTLLLDRGLLALVGVLAVLVVVALGMLLGRRRSDAWAERIDRWLLKVPVIGSMQNMRETLNLLFAMESLTQGGFTVEDALQEAGAVVGNRAFRNGIGRAREQLLKGGDLSEAFLADPVFSRRLGHWIAVGERSGQVARVFSQLRIYYQNELEKWSARFMNLVEPILILCVGVILFLVILFFIVPIFSIYEGLTL
jgi:type II secretory pathway component PulF